MNHAVRPRSRLLVAVVLAIASVVSLAACGESTSGSGETPSTGNISSEAVGEGDPVIGGNLSYALSAESTGWSPTMDQWSPSSFNVARAIFDPLVVTGVDGQFQPWLAESLTPNDAGTVWTIDIRKGIRFQNGEDVDAAAIVLERGGPLSHAAILARELGVPAVLNVPGATRLDGERVTVDGDAGVVVLEPGRPR